MLKLDNRQGTNHSSNQENRRDGPCLCNTRLGEARCLGNELANCCVDCLWPINNHSETSAARFAYYTR